MTKEIDGNEFETLLGKRVILFCTNYFYSGVLKAVSNGCLLLQDAAIVYETGEWTASKWKDEQKMGRDVFVRIMSVEAFSTGK